MEPTTSKNKVIVQKKVLHPKHFLQHFYNKTIGGKLLLVLVRTQFVATHNNVGFARKKAQTISFIERGFERLGLGQQTVNFSWCSYIVKSCSL